MEEVTLRIRDKEFKVKKQTLCEHSDYFRAMFSGNYVEERQNQINIGMLDPDIVSIILKYMEIGLIDILEYPMSTVSDIATTSIFLQITELIKQIEFTLDLHLSESNWIETMAVAKIANFSKLKHISAGYGLLSFKSTDPQRIPNLHKLAWYLSHPYLDTRNELDVFEFGYQWILKNNLDADALLIILGCLDLKKITHGEMVKLKSYMSEYENSLACKVIECLFKLSSNNLDLSETVVRDRKTELCQEFTERVVIEVLNLVRESKRRLLKHTAAVSMWIIEDNIPQSLPHWMYTFVGVGFEQWLKVGEKNLWGFSVVPWGLNKLVVVCGEHGKGTGVFVLDVKVYDTFREEWTRHGVVLPKRRHAGAVVIGDLLYLVGGVGAKRVVLKTALVYDLKQRSYRNIAKFPETMQNPAVCSHNNMLYAAGERNIYLYKNEDFNDYWEKVVETDIRMSFMKSFKGYIYCIQNFFSQLYRFKPGVSEKLEQIARFSSTPAILCDVAFVWHDTPNALQTESSRLDLTQRLVRAIHFTYGVSTIPVFVFAADLKQKDRLLAFTRSVCGESDTLVVEEYKQESDDEIPNVIFSKTDTSMRINDTASSCVLITKLPPLSPDRSQYINKYLTRYTYLKYFYFLSFDLSNRKYYKFC